MSSSFASISTEESFVDGKHGSSLSPLCSPPPLTVTSCSLSNVDDSTPAVTENYCTSLLEKHFPVGFEMPDECRSFASFRANLQQQKSSQEDTDVAFAGMSAREALEAKSAREHGRLNNAQILRRMSSRSKKSESSWF
jgi:hypothetical protein